MRHSDRHGFDVGRCQDCRMVFVLDPPTPEAVGELYAEPERETRYAERLREDTRSQDAVLDRLDALVGRGTVPGPPVLFDVGAGTGEFLARAKGRGSFDVRGNDLSPTTAAYASTRHGVEVTTATLDQQPAASVDAVTMWCVLAHVPDPNAFLTEAFELLRPGGVLFLRTPRWCAIDVAGTGLARLPGRRFSRVADRRVTNRHMHIYDEQNLALALRNAGFEPIDVSAVCHYGFSAQAYAETMGQRSWPRPLVRALDGLIERDRFVKNTLFAYARRP